MSDPPIPPTPSATSTSQDSGSADSNPNATGESASASKSPNSESYAEPSKPSSRPYRLPSSVREFAAQANMVATRVLNGEIDLDTARVYSAVARTVAQAITAETTHARFLKTAPDLTFPEMEDDE